MQTWEEATKWEADWHGNCVNSYQEESKQITYAQRMGLSPFNKDGRYPVFDLAGKSVIDVGGGPYSLLLKCVNVHGVVVDPLDMPQWCKDRYKAANVGLIQKKGEDLKIAGNFDEAWCYNVLQHVDNPKKVIQNMRKSAKLIRVHEWLETPISEGHIHSFTERELNMAFNGRGFVGTEDWGNGWIQKYYVGIFAGI